MILKLDPLHKLSLIKRTWVLYKYKKLYDYSEAQLKELQEANKQCVVMEYKNGEKTIGVWSRISDYPFSSIGIAVTDWLESIISSHVDIDQEINVDSIMKFFNGIEKQLKGIRVLSSLLRINIKMDMVSELDLEKIDKEMQLNTIFKSSDSGADQSTKGKRKFFIGPNVVFTPVVVSILNPENAMKIIDGSNVNIETEPNLFVTDSNNIEFVKTDSIIPIPNKRGRPGRPKKITQIPSNTNNTGGFKPVKRK